MATGPVDGRAAVERRGLLFVISSPSGAGKTTLSRRLLDAVDDVTLSVSVTTRPAREGEQDGVHYFFRTPEAFAQMRDEGALLEWAQVFDNFYGTPRAPVAALLEQGRDVLFDIDWQGAQQLSEKMANDLVRVFILPPSAKTLRDRLEGRATDAPEVIAKRLSRASDEISHWAQYDYVIINDDIEKSAQELIAILEAERVRRDRRVGLARFVRQLQADL